MGRKVKNRMGVRNERLIVKKFIGTNFYNQTLWLCLCDCGKEIIVSGCNLQNKSTKSCGCLRKEILNNQLDKNNPNYVHGKNCNGNCTKAILELKESIRKRDSYLCKECGKTQKQNLKETNEILSVHHIDGDDTNNTEDNMITLCKGCHMKKPKGIKNEKENESI